MSGDLLGEARRRVDAGDPRSAQRLAERALEVSRAAGASREVAACAQILGECLYIIGDVPAARALAEEALRLDEADGDPARLGADLNLLGVVELTLGRTEQALPHLRRSYELRAEVLGPDDEETIESLNNVGVALWRGGDQEEAIATHEDALRRCERALGDAHRRTAETLNALAVKLQSLPESSARARELYERALVAAEAALGPDSELVARLLTNVAMARVNDDEMDGTAEMLERALELHERHFGPMSRWTAYVLTAQGNLAGAEDRWADARRPFERAFVISMNELGPTDPETLDNALGLASALSAGDFEGMNEATAIYLPVMALRPGEDTGELPRSALPGPDRAVEQLRQIAARITQRIAPDPAQAAAAAEAERLTEEADVAYLAGDVGAAADQLREAIALLEVARGPSDPSLVELLHRLKLVTRVGGTESAVMLILERIAAILSDAYGATHPMAIRALGEIYWQERREYGPAGGRETADRIERLAQSALGAGNRVAQMISDVLSAARAAVPAGLEPEAEALSIRRERIIAEPSPLADELLSDLGATPWPALDHAYGRAIDTPRHLRLLLTEDERVRDDALDLLGDSLLQEGLVPPATVPAVRLIRRLAGDARVPGRPRLIAFLTAAAVQAASVEGPPGDELRATMVDLPSFLRYLLSTEPETAVGQAAVQALAEIER
ncbi:MAG TPA: tetratricopeptide repeat protein [Candidatus Limnocylindria bacterium]